MAGYKISDVITRMDARSFDYEKFGGRRIPEARKDAEFVHGLAEAQRFVNMIKEGRYTLRDFKEAMTTSDFPLYFATNLQRQLLDKYQSTPSSWEQWARKVTVNDFKEMELIGITGGDDRLTKHGEDVERKQGNLGEKKYSVSVDIYEKGLGLSEKAIRNDDLNAFANIPTRLGRGAKRTEEYLATTMIADASGPHADLFNVDNDNLITRALSIQGLREAATKLATQTDSNGEPIYNEPAVLSVVPALKIPAQEILRSIQVEITQGSEKVTTLSQFSNLKLAVLYYAPMVMSSANSTTTWYLSADPNQADGAIAAVGRMRGLEEPGVYTKAPNAINVNGGGYDIVDFDSNEMEWKAKHFVGAAQMESKFGVGSTGTVAAGA